MAKTLLVSNRSEDEGFVLGISNANASELTVVRNLGDASTAILNPSFKCVFIDISDPVFLEIFKENIEAIEKAGAGRRVHLIGDKDLSVYRESLLNPAFCHFLSRTKNEDFAASAKVYATYLNVLEKRRNISPDQLLGEGCRFFKQKLTHTRHRKEIETSLSELFEARSIQARMRETMLRACDEMIMNAIFDAPVDETGARPYRCTPRSEVRPLSERESVWVEAGFDGEHFVISVIDNFGSLNREGVLSHVCANYRNQKYETENDRAGAGLGLYTINVSGGSLIYQCDPGRRTRATLIYRTFPAFVDFKNQFRFFSLDFNETPH